MDFTSLLGFIVIAVISSLFNKKDNTTKRRKKANTTMRPKAPTTSGESVTSMSEKGNGRKRTFSGSLEDLFSELKLELDKNLNETKVKQSYYDPDQDVVTKDNIEVEREEKKDWHDNPMDDHKLNKDTVYHGEIGKNETPIEFNRKSIVQGVIMSEILKKPKSLRR